MQYLNLFLLTIVRLISHREHNVHVTRRGNTRQHTFCTVLNFIYIVGLYIVGKHLENTGIQIVIGYEVKLKIYHISRF